MPPAPTKHQILVTATINAAVDEIATEFHKYAKETLPVDREVVVIRYHSWSSERAIVQRDNTDSPSPGAMARATLYKMALSNLDNICITSEMIKHIRAANTYPHSGVPDKRVQVLKQSHGYWMLCIAGYYAKEPCQHTNADCFANAHLIIRDYNASKVNH